MDRTALLHHVIDWAEREQAEASRLFVEAEGERGGRRALLLGDRDRMIARSGALVEVARLIHDWAED